MILFTFRPNRSVTQVLLTRYF